MPTASPSAAALPTSAPNSAAQAMVSQAAKPATLSPQMAALQKELEKARQDNRQTALALKAAKNKLERARRAKRDADAALQQANILSPGPAGNPKLAKAHHQVFMAASGVTAAEKELAAAEAAQTAAAERRRELEQRQRIFVAIGARCLDPQTAEEARQCRSDFRKASSGNEQDLETVLGPALLSRYEALEAAQSRREERQRLQSALAAFPECLGQLHNFSDIVIANPYQTRGVCYAMPALQVIQWLSASRVLADAGSAQFIVDMPHPPATNVLPSSWVIGEDAFQYTTVTGALKTVPHLRVLR